MTCNDVLNLLCDWKALRFIDWVVGSYPLPWLTLSVPYDLLFDKLNIKTISRYNIKTKMCLESWGVAPNPIIVQDFRYPQLCSSLPFVENQLDDKCCKFYFELSVYTSYLSMYVDPNTCFLKYPPANWVGFSIPHRNISPTHISSWDHLSGRFPVQKQKANTREPLLTRLNNKTKQSTTTPRENIRSEFILPFFFETCFSGS